MIATAPEKSMNINPLSAPEKGGVSTVESIGDIHKIFAALPVRSPFLKPAKARSGAERLGGQKFSPRKEICCSLSRHQSWPLAPERPHLPLLKSLSRAALVRIGVTNSLCQVEAFCRVVLHGF